MTIDPVLVKSGFAAVEPHGPAVAGYFYQHLFEHNPDVRGLFAEHLDEQQDRLWAALGALLTRLEDTDTLVGILRDLGARHAGYGAVTVLRPLVDARDREGVDRGVHGDRPGDDRGRRRRPGRRHRLGQTLALLEQLAARSKGEQYDLAAAGRQLARNNRLRVLLAAPAPGNRRDDAVGMVRAVLLRHGDWSGWDVHLSGPPDLAPALAELPAGLGADPGRVLHDPVPVTFDRTRPLTSSDWFLDQRDVPWINRTELG